MQEVPRRFAKDLKDITIADMVGQTPVSISGEKGDDELLFVMESGLRFRFHHYQDCCENVQIEDVCGDLQSLVGRPLLRADEESNADGPESDGYPRGYSGTWTFYKFASIGGYADVRWLGESNGYYSESVDLDVYFTDPLEETNG